MDHKPVNKSAVSDHRQPPDPRSRTQAQSASPVDECDEDLSCGLAAFIERLAHLVADEIVKRRSHDRRE